MLCNKYECEELVKAYNKGQRDCITEYVERLRAKAEDVAQYRSIDPNDYMSDEEYIIMFDHFEDILYEVLDDMKLDIDIY